MSQKQPRSVVRTDQLFTAADGLTHRSTEATFGGYGHPGDADASWPANEAHVALPRGHSPCTVPHTLTFASHIAHYHVPLAPCTIQIAMTRHRSNARTCNRVKSSRKPTCTETLTGTRKRKKARSAEDKQFPPGHGEKADNSIGKHERKPSSSAPAQTRCPSPPHGPPAGATSGVGVAGGVYGTQMPPSPTNPKSHSYGGSLPAHPLLHPIQLITPNDASAHPIRCSLKLTCKWLSDIPNLVTDN
jgi:hypothetical protein